MSSSSVELPLSSCFFSYEREPTSWFEWSRLNEKEKVFSSRKKTVTFSPP